MRYDLNIFQKGGGRFHEVSCCSQRCVSSDCRMKRSRVTWMTRYVLLVVLLYALAIGMFLIPSCRSGQKSTISQRDSYLRMITAGVREKTYQEDELEPSHYIPALPEIEAEYASWSVEAETVKIPKGVEILRDRPGYSGIGYLGKLPEHTKSALTIPIHVPYTQHYSLTICLGSDYGGNGAVRINDALVSPFSLEAGKTFTRVTFYGLFLEKGKTTVALDTEYGHLECDYIELSSDTSLDDTRFDIPETPCDADASDAAKKLYEFLRDHWGERMLTGQYVSDSANRELGIIYSLTGQLPVIRFSELGTDRDPAQIESAIDWNVYLNGVVGLMWQWKAPGSDSVYTNDTEFDLEAALFNVDPSRLAGMSQDEIQTAIRKLDLPKGSLELVKDIDSIAESLRKFADMDIPVLWRPLHEAGGEWYWWGSAGPTYYVRLWELLYQRLTSYHQLHNLIWIWNAQSSEYCVPDDTYDIASVDIYLKPEHSYGSRYEQFVSLARITDGQKMLALSECSAPPDLKMLSIDRSVWSFYGLWYGEYIMNPDGSFSDRYYSSNDLYNLYNSDLAFNLNDFLSLCQ